MRKIPSAVSAFVSASMLVALGLLVGASALAQGSAARRVGTCEVGPDRVIATSTLPLQLGRGAIGYGATGALAVWFDGAAGRSMPLDASGTPAVGAMPGELALEGSSIVDVLPLDSGFVVITAGDCHRSGDVDCYLLHQTSATGQLVGRIDRLNVGDLRIGELAAAEDGSLVAMLVVPLVWDDPFTVVEVRASSDGPRMELAEFRVRPLPNRSEEPTAHRYSLVASAGRWGFVGPLAGGLGEATLARSGVETAPLPVALPPMTPVTVFFDGAALRYVVVEGDGTRGTGFRSGVLSAEGEVRPDAESHPAPEPIPDALHGDARGLLDCDDPSSPVALTRVHGLYGAWVPGGDVAIARARRPRGLVNTPVCAVATRDRRYLTMWADAERGRWRLHVASVRCSDSGG